MNLPQLLRWRLARVFGGHGRRWVQDFPALLAEIRAAHGLTHLRRASPLSWHFVAFARHPQWGDVVLKMGVPEPELRAEIAALQLNAGRSLPRLFAADAQRGWLLMERICPGTMLADWDADDAAASRAAARTLTGLWQDAVPAHPDLIPLTAWFERAFAFWQEDPDQPIPPEWRAALDDFLPAALAAPPRLLHGDFHHFNILRAGDGWKAIDPKGVIGPPGYDIGPFLLNPWPDFLKRRDVREQLARRIEIFSVELGLPAEEIRLWGLAHAVLSTIWDVQGAGHTDGYALKLGKLLWEMS